MPLLPQAAWPTRKIGYLDRPVKKQGLTHLLDRADQGIAGFINASRYNAPQQRTPMSGSTIQIREASRPNQVGPEFRRIEVDSDSVVTVE